MAWSVSLQTYCQGILLSEQEIYENLYNIAGALPLI